MDPETVPNDTQLILFDDNGVLLVTVSLMQQTRNAAYVAVVALSVAIWGWILSLAEESRIVKRCRRSAPVIAYYLARVSIVALCTSSLTFYLPGFRNCAKLLLLIGSMATLGGAAKAYLFLLRVRAVYGNSMRVRLTIILGWIIVVCSQMSLAPTIHTASFGQQGYCTMTYTGFTPGLSLWLNLAYDTGVFVAISVRLSSYRLLPSNASLLSSFRGDGLPLAMRYFLRDGQLYYFTTVIFALAAAIIATVMAPYGPVVSTQWAVLSLAIESSMTCKVFSNMISRSLDGDPDRSAGPLRTELSAAELDTTFELNLYMG